MGLAVDCGAAPVTARIHQALGQVINPALAFALAPVLSSSSDPE